MLSFSGKLMAPSRQASWQRSQFVQTDVQREKTRRSASARRTIARAGHTDAQIPQAVHLCSSMDSFPQGSVASHLDGSSLSNEASAMILRRSDLLLGADLRFRPANTSHRSSSSGTADSRSIAAATALVRSRSPIAEKISLLPTDAALCFGRSTSLTLNVFNSRVCIND